MVVLGEIPLESSQGQSIQVLFRADHLSSILMNIIFLIGQSDKARSEELLYMCFHASIPTVVPILSVLRLLTNKSIYTTHSPAHMCLMWKKEYTKDLARSHSIVRFTGLQSDSHYFLHKGNVQRLWYGGIDSLSVWWPQKRRGWAHWCYHPGSCCYTRRC